MPSHNQKQYCYKTHYNRYPRHCCFHITLILSACSMRRTRILLQACPHCQTVRRRLPANHLSCVFFFCNAVIISNIPPTICPLPPMTKKTDSSKAKKQRKEAIDNPYAITIIFLSMIAPPIQVLSSPKYISACNRYYSQYSLPGLRGGAEQEGCKAYYTAPSMNAQKKSASSLESLNTSAVLSWDVVANHTVPSR